MNLIDDVLDAVTDPDTGLWNALDATYTAAAHLDRATRRNDGSLGAKQVLKRAQVEVESAQLLPAVLDEPFRTLFPALMPCFHELDAYRAAAADEALDEYAHPVEGGSLAYERSVDELSDAEGFAREALAKVLAGELTTAVAA